MQATTLSSRPARARAPLVEPVGFVLESVSFDVARARLPEFRPGAVLAPSAVAYRIDEDSAFERMRAAARATADGSVVEVADRRTGFLDPDAAVSLERDAGSATRVNDDERLVARATLGDGWQAYDLHVDLSVRAGGGTTSRATASTQMPADLWLQIVVVPEERAAAPERARVVFVRATRVWPPTGDA